MQIGRNLTGPPGKHLMGEPDHKLMNTAPAFAGGPGHLLPRVQVAAGARAAAWS